MVKRWVNAQVVSFPTVTPVRKDKSSCGSNRKPYPPRSGQRGGSYEVFTLTVMIRGLSLVGCFSSDATRLPCDVELGLPENWTGAFLFGLSKVREKLLLFLRQNLHFYSNLMKNCIWIYMSILTHCESFGCLRLKKWVKAHVATGLEKRKKSLQTLLNFTRPH